MTGTLIENDRKPQVFAIQYLRAIAALMVVFHHAIIPRPWLFNPLAGVDIGARGVDIFFVISGFVMFTAARNEPILTFYFRRIIRVVPLYWSATIASIAIHIFLTGDGVSRLNIIRSFLFVPFHNPTHGGLIWPLLVPGWTLNYEMFFYLLFGLSLFLRKPIAFTGTAIVALVAIGFVTSPSGAVSITYTNPILLEFLAGIVIGKAYQIHRFDRAAIAMPLGIFLLLAGHFWHFPLFISGGIAAVLIVIGALALESRGIVRAWQFPLLLGKASYSIYLVHFLLWELLIAAWETLPLQGWVQFLALVTAVFGTSIAVGIFVHKMLEVPMTRSLRTLSGKWPRNRALSPSSVN